MTDVKSPEIEQAKQLTELEPRLPFVGTPYENALHRIAWLYEQRDCFTPEGFIMALAAMEQTAEQHHTRILQ